MKAQAIQLVRPLIDAVDFRFARNRVGGLVGYFVLTYIAVLVSAIGFLRLIEYQGALTFFYVSAVYLTYCWLYVAMAFVPAALAEGLLLLPGLRRFFGPRAQDAVVFGLAVAGTSLAQVFVFADRFVFSLYGFHFNGFVWNLVFTRGGLESMGGTRSSQTTFGLIIAALIGLQAILLAVVIKIPRVRAFFSRSLKARRVILALGLLAAAAIFERGTYGISSLRGYRPVLAASNAFPLYMPTTVTKLARRLGMEVVRQPSLASGEISLGTTYPRQPITLQPMAQRPNIVWLVAESLRDDMVDPEIMPTAWKLAHQAVWCREHYSGGNGTRMGMFSMFYGLYGCFWFPIFEAQRSPVLMDVVQDAGYQIELFTSASFTYPEFDRTMFVNVPADRLHEAQTALPWRRDRQNIAEMLEFIDDRDPARPFMTFMFFESPHAPYHFPKECVIRTPYVEDLNYATMDLQKDIVPIKNRYINSCNHVDLLLGRVLAHLQQRGLMESTIVIFTGDHGEEFMENGRWGHNSGFTEGQIRPPLVMWIPGRGHREIKTMTSHLDIPATLMPLIGVTNPATDYSFGFNLLGPPARDYTVICDWHHVACVDANYKIVLPFNAYGFAELAASTRDDRPVTENADFTADYERLMPRFMADLRAFRR